MEVSATAGIAIDQVVKQAAHVVTNWRGEALISDEDAQRIYTTAQRDHAEWLHRNQKWTEWVNYIRPAQRKAALDKAYVAAVSKLPERSSEAERMVAGRAAARLVAAVFDAQGQQAEFEVWLRSQ